MRLAASRSARRRASRSSRRASRARTTAGSGAASGRARRAAPRARGPSAPAWMRAARETASTSSTRSSAREVERDRAVVAVAGTRGSTPPTTLVPPPYGITATPRVRRPLEHALDVGLVARARDDVGRVVEAAAERAHDVAVGLARRRARARVVACRSSRSPRASRGRLDPRRRQRDAVERRPAPRAPARRSRGARRAPARPRATSLGAGCSSS